MQRILFNLLHQPNSMKLQRNKYGYHIRYKSALLAHHYDSNYYLMVRLPFFKGKVKYLHDSKKRPRFRNLKIIHRLRYVFSMYVIIGIAIMFVIHPIGYIFYMVSKVLRIIGFAIMAKKESAKEESKDFWKVQLDFLDIF
jgi:hypothetical protein